MGLEVTLSEIVNQVILQEVTFNLTFGDSIYTGLPSDGAVDRYQSTPPTSETDAGTKGYYSVDDDYFYVCVSTNKWKKTPLMRII